MGVFMRLFLGSMCGITWAVVLASVDSRERSEEDAPASTRYRPLLPYYLLPMFMGMLVVMWAFLGWRQGFELMLTTLFNVFGYIGIYYLLLCLLLPLARRYVSARVCAALWLLPNYLYVLTQPAYELPNPVFALWLPDGWIGGLFLVWAAGFLGVLGWKIVSHFRFRRYILWSAREVEEADVLALWEKEQRRAGFGKTPYTLVRSDRVSTPLTIGFFKRSIRVVLPERDYTPEELRLIFRHELVHIGREDAGTKFFLAFCAAMCWFNPLMWWAMRRSAEDLELSCDETVLLEANDRTRRQYADLILTTAGDGRGFTTCLAAGVKSLRYRLRHIVAPRKRAEGALLGGLVFFLIFMTCGYTALGYERLSGEEALFGGRGAENFTVTVAEWKTDSARGFDACDIRDEAALRDYLAGLDFYKITGNYTFMAEEHGLSLRCKQEGVQSVTLVDLTDRGVIVYRPESGRLREFRYACRDVDWAYLEELLAVE